ncbi:protein kinase family protein [Desulfocicer niacini]
MTYTPTSFDPLLFPPVLAALKQSLSGVDEIRKRDLDIEKMTLDPGPMKNNYYPVDVTYKGLIRDMAGSPAAFILCANPVGKTLVRDNVEKARAAKALLSSPHDRIIDLPFLSGDVQGISWALYDLNIALSQNRWVWQVQKRLLTPMVSRWLTDVLETTNKPVSPTDLPSMIVSPLEALCREKAFAGEMTKAAADALKRIESGAWKPCTALAHNDLWRGNIMRPPHTSVFTRQFRVIDWAGSDVCAIPFFDLFKFLQSFTVPQGPGKKLIQTHCHILKCSPMDTTGYLLTALGVLGQNLNQFPHHAYVNLAMGLYTLHHKY